jgi:hypothetical protein
MHAIYTGKLSLVRLTVNAGWMVARSDVPGR